MSFFKRAKELAGELASAGRRRAQRGKLQVEVRRLESKVASEKAAIGQAVYPFLEAGTLGVDLPEVDAHVKAITGLLAQIASKQAEFDAHGAAAAGKKRQAASVRNVDANATPEAASQQSAKDVVAEEHGNPADQGGQG